MLHVLIVFFVGSFPFLKPCKQTSGKPLINQYEDTCAKPLEFICKYANVKPLDFVSMQASGKPLGFDSYFAPAPKQGPRQPRGGIGVVAVRALLSPSFVAVALSCETKCVLI